MFPPVPESPVRQRPSRAAGTPRGMDLYQDDAEDDVSVLTFHTHHTLGTSGGASFVRSARENLERMIESSKMPGEEDRKSLMRIAEEAGSISSKASTSKSLSSKASSAKSVATNRTKGDYAAYPESFKSLSPNEKERIEDDHDSDDDTLSLAESILDSTNKVLSNIGSSPFFRRKLVSSIREPSSPTPDLKRPANTNGTEPTDLLSNTDHSTQGELSSSKESSHDREHRLELSRRFHGPSDEPDFASAKKESNAHEDQIEVSSSFLNSYFGDENTEPAARRPSRSASGDDTNPHVGHSKGSGAVRSDQHICRLEVETELLRSLLRERRLDTRRASETLGASLQKAHALLEAGENQGRDVHEDLDLQKLEAATKRLWLRQEERRLETQRTDKTLGASVSVRKANALLERLAEDWCA